MRTKALTGAGCLCGEQGEKEEGKEFRETTTLSSSFRLSRTPCSV